MREAKKVARRINGWCVFLSFLVHGLAFVSVFLNPTPKPTSALQDGSITVEIIASAPAPRTLVNTDPIANNVPPPPAKSALPSSSGNEPTTKPVERAHPPPPNPPAEDAKERFVKPSHMLSQEVLADRRSKQALEALKQLAPAEQIEQLCNLEAMAQVGEWQVGEWSKKLKPDRVVAYAMADPKMSGTDFFAEGAAIHSEAEWYRLQFKCQLTPNKRKVAAFEFLLGDTIPKEIWGEHNLQDEDGASD